LKPALLTDDAGEVRSPIAAIEGSYLRSGLHKASVLGSYRKVAHHVQDVPAADGPPGDHRDDRLGAGPDLALEIQDVQPLDAASFLGVASVPPDALIPARAEGVGAFAGQDDDPDLVVVAGVFQCPSHLLDR
jgi:hypothetical protein